MEHALDEKSELPEVSLYGDGEAGERIVNIVMEEIKSSEVVVELC